VDDAIIVVEAVQHFIDEQHMTPRKPLTQAMKEISAPVSGHRAHTGAVVCAVGFIPVSIGACTSNLPSRLPYR